MTKDAIEKLMKEFDELFPQPSPLISPPRLYFTPGNLTDEMVNAESAIDLVPDLKRYGVTLDGLADWSVAYLDAFPNDQNYVKQLIQTFVADAFKQPDKERWTGVMVGLTLGAALTLKQLEMQARHGGEWRECNQPVAKPSINKTNKKEKVN
jgi:hypothetical protein